MMCERVVKRVSVHPVSVVLSIRTESRSLMFWPSKISHLHNENLVFNLLNDFLLFILGTVGVDVHRRLDILVSHHRLDHLEVGFVFTKPGAEGMS